MLDFVALVYLSYLSCLENRQKVFVRARCFAALCMTVRWLSKQAHPNAIAIPRTVFLIICGQYGLIFHAPSGDEKQVFPRVVLFLSAVCWYFFSISRIWGRIIDCIRGASRAVSFPAYSTPGFVTAACSSIYNKPYPTITLWSESERSHVYRLRPVICWRLMQEKRIIRPALSEGEMISLLDTGLYYSAWRQMQDR